MIEEMPAQSPQFTHYYSSLLNRLAFRWVDIRKRQTLRNGIPTDARKVLDVGCGAGAVSSAALLPRDLHGLDSDPALLDAARKNGITTLIRGSFNDPIPFPDHHFDAVCMIDSIEHVEHPHAVAAEVRRILKPGGTFVAITPNYSSPLWNLGETFANLVSGQPSGHISPFTPESLRHLLDQHFSSHQIGRLNFGMWLYGTGRTARS